VTRGDSMGIIIGMKKCIIDENMNEKLFVVLISF